MIFQKDAEAIAILSKYHANGRERDPLVYFTYGQIREALAIEREINQTTSYLTLFKTPGNLRRMRIVFALGFFSQWSGNGLISYYLDPVLENVGVTVPSTRALINGGIQIWCFRSSSGGENRSTSTLFDVQRRNGRRICVLDIDDRVMDNKAESTGGERVDCVDADLLPGV
ncbi:hypothetical protein FRC20_003304 [Serendipita sp. 405]|nr:hypothetical protein FRC15_003401 [Serendipita sp. 397]KAG8845090.1 hypothetical protein FRC20_003304 [Serendipita sp. 405]